MNKKEGTAIIVLLLTSFAGGAFATGTVPAAPTTLQATGVDIEVLKIIPGSGAGQSVFGQLTFGITVFSNAPRFNFTAGFSFAPAKGFIRVTSVVLTTIYVLGSVPSSGDAFSVHLNGDPSGGIPLGPASYTGLNTLAPNIVSGNLLSQNVRPGANSIDIGINQGTSGGVVLNLYEVRLTVEYVFMA